MSRTHCFKYRSYYTNGSFSSRILLFSLAGKVINLKENWKWLPFVLRSFSSYFRVKKYCVADKQGARNNFESSYFWNEIEHSFLFTIFWTSFPWSLFGWVMSRTHCFSYRSYYSNGSFSSRIYLYYKVPFANKRIFGWGHNPSFIHSKNLGFEKLPAPCGDFR